jgi:anti-sigma regulatory factor (Ser/Thr protein kinase)
MADERFTVTGGVHALRPAARRAMIAVCHLGVPGARAQDVELAVHETLANALEHGHLDDPNLPIEVEVAGGGPATVTVRIRDHALAGPRPVVGGRGRGLRLVTAMADGVEVHAASGHATVTLRWSTGSGGSGEVTTIPEVRAWRS